MIPTIEGHRKKWNRCISCDLGVGQPKGCRVHNRGRVPCHILIIGEAPGDSEIATRKPFMGLVGDKLDSLIIEVFDPETYEEIKDDINAFKLYQSKFRRSGTINGYKFGFNNAVVCPPRDSPTSKLRAPTNKEIEACNIRLFEFLAITLPQFIVAAGRPAEMACKKLVDQFAMDVPYRHVPHPSSILRQEERGSLDEARFKTVLKEAKEHVIT